MTLEDLNKALERYAGFRGMPMAQVLARQGRNLSIFLRQELSGMAPAKGQIRAQLLADLKSGSGVKVRKSVYEKVAKKYGMVGAFGKYSFRSEKKVRGKVKGFTEVKFEKSKLVNGKRMNFQALAVQAEINRRESGRRFLMVSTVRGAANTILNFATSRYGPVLSHSKATMKQNGAELRFAWDGNANELADSAAEGMKSPKAKAAIDLAIQKTTSDINTWIDSEIEKSVRTQTGLVITKALNPGMKL